jgi:hypothetical protein
MQDPQGPVAMAGHTAVMDRFRRSKFAHEPNA